MGYGCVFLADLLAHGVLDHPGGAAGVRVVAATVLVGSAADGRGATDEYYKAEFEVE